MAWPQLTKGWYMIKRTVSGIGYNSGGVYKRTEHGKPTKVYLLWLGIFNRCYSDYQLERRPSYKGCTIDERWHDFQDFAKWCDEHKYSDMGYQLDKDILVVGNKVYSPETCCFVPSELNTLCNAYLNARGEHPQGVYWNKRAKKYLSRIRIHGKHKHLGYFDCPKEAHQAYVIAKEAHVKVMANLWFGSIDPKVYCALMDWRVR